MSQEDANIRERDPATVGRVVADPQVLAGKPRIAGTRISVELILEEMSAGTSMDDLIHAHPQLQPDDIRAAFAYALRSVRHEEVRPLAPGTGSTA